MLTKQEKKQLKSLGSKLTIKYQIGKNDISNNVIDLLDKALTAHELIKVDVLRNNHDPIMEIALDLSFKLHAEIIQVIGRVIVLYRQNKEKPKIKLLK